MATIEIFGELHSTTSDGIIADISQIRGADQLGVKDGSVTESKLANGAVTKTKLATALQGSIDKAENAMPKSGGQFAGHVSWKDGSVSAKTSPQYFLTMDAFSDGGTTGYTALANAKEALGVNAAQTAANNAASAASTAQSTANSAKTTADAAMPKAGGTFTGAVTLSGAPTSNLHAATKKYVDDTVAPVKTTADGAKSSAESAVESAKEARTIANNALSKAEEKLMKPGFYASDSNSQTLIQEQTIAGYETLRSPEVGDIIVNSLGDLLLIKSAEWNVMAYLYTVEKCGSIRGPQGLGGGGTDLGYAKIIETSQLGFEGGIDGFLHSINDILTLPELEFNPAEENIVIETSFYYYDYDSGTYQARKMELCAFSHDFIRSLPEEGQGLVDTYYSEHYPEEVGSSSVEMWLGYDDLPILIPLNMSGEEFRAFLNCVSQYSDEIQPLSQYTTLYKL